MTTSNPATDTPSKATRAKRNSTGKATGSAKTPKQLAAEQADPALRAKVQKYLDRFSKAMTKGDTKTVASLWAIPAFVVDKQSTRVIQDSAEVEQFFSGAPEMYHERGIEDTRAEIQALDVVDETLVIVRVRWPYLDHSGREIGEESSTYTLKADESGDFKMCVCTMRGAKPSAQA